MLGESSILKQVFEFRVIYVILILSSKKDQQVVMSVYQSLLGLFWRSRERLTNQWVLPQDFVYTGLYGASIYSYLAHANNWALMSARVRKPKVCDVGIEYD